MSCCCPCECPCECVCYTQPPRRPICRPCDSQIFPRDCVDCCSIYKTSFCPIRCARRPSLRQDDNLKPPPCKLDANTTHRLSFPCLPVVKRCPILPCYRKIIGEGPFSCVTTQRHDYVPKCVPKLPPIVPPAHLSCSTERMDCTTIMNSSYLPVCGGKQSSYKPKAEYCKTPHPFQDETVSRLSYVPWPVKRKEHYPWACKGKYEAPCCPLECTSIYKSSYPPPGSFNCCCPAPSRCLAPCCSAPACCPTGASKAACFDDC